MENFKFISTSSLRAYYALLKNNEDRCTAFLAQLTSQDDPSYNDAKDRSDQVKNSLSSVTEELNKRQDKLIYSVEDIYKLVGHNDSYCMIEFFPRTPAYEKYSESVHGTIWYKKKDREILDIAVAVENYGRNNGTVHLTSGSEDKNLNDKLKFEGFDTNDIKTIYRIGAPNQKTYKQSGTKSIPNTITVEIDSNFDVVGSQQYILGNYLKTGYSLPRHDLIIYYRNLFLFYPQLLKEEDKNQYLLNSARSTFTDEADLSIHEIKVHKKIATKEEIENWSELLKKRSTRRMDFIKQHLGISAKRVDYMILNDTKKYITLVQSSWMFETETLIYLGPKACIYWDFERFIHIFLRHNPDFFVPASTKRQGTHFQYEFRDISRVAKIILEQLRDGINAKLAQGKPFVVNGHYYNGNHYQIRIDQDGRLMQFHPLD